MINGYKLDLTQALHLIEGILIYSGALYVLLKKYGYWEKIFHAKSSTPMENAKQDSMKK